MGFDGRCARDRGRGREAWGGGRGGGRELFLVFLDDWEDDLFVCVVSLDDIRTMITATPSQYNATCNSRRYSPLKIATSLIRLRTPSSSDAQDHPSESPIPLSGFPRGTEDEEGGQRARNGNPPPKLNSEPGILPTSSPKASRDLIDPPEIRVNGFPPGPSDRSGGNL